MLWSCCSSVPLLPEPTILTTIVQAVKMVKAAKKNTCLLPIMQGYCRSNDGMGGFCGWGKSSSVEDCIQGGLKLGYSTFQIEGDGTTCSYISYSRDKPTDCPVGFTPVAMAGSFSRYYGQGSANVQCIGGMGATSPPQIPSTCR